MTETGLQTLDKRDYQLFMKKLRKFNKDYTEEPIRYYSVGEYGTETCRPHYHSIIFNLAPESVVTIYKHWNKGIVHVGSVTGASIHYVTKYVINRHGDFHDRQLPFSLISNRSGGIGKNYVDSNKKWHKRNKALYVVNSGHKQRIPRFYKDKIFTELERQVLAKLNEGKLIQLEEKELKRLSKYHQDPFAYMWERKIKKNNSINSKINLTNTI